MAAMGSLYLVRHGQASLASADYDQLSSIGEHQARRLGGYWRVKGLRFDAVICGTLRRHRQTLAGIAQGLAGDASAGAEAAGAVLPAALDWPGLNEYDSHALVRCVHPGELPVLDNREAVRQHFRLLRQGLLAWMAGTATPQGMCSHQEFVEGVVGALDHVRQQCQGNVLLVSSGGPIATAVGHLLGATPEAVVELNLQIRNSAISEFSFNARRHVLVGFNALPHLDAPEHAAWLTHA
jgi:broad specificity phosphatase PhoE